MKESQNVTKIEHFAWDVLLTWHIPGRLFIIIYPDSSSFSGKQCVCIWWIVWRKIWTFHAAIGSKITFDLGDFWLLDDGNSAVPAFCALPDHLIGSRGQRNMWPIFAENFFRALNWNHWLYEMSRVFKLFLLGRSTIKIYPAYYFYPPLLQIYYSYSTIPVNQKLTLYICMHMKVSPSNHGGASRSVTVPQILRYGVPTKQHFPNKRPKNLTFPTMTQYSEYIGKIQLGSSILRELFQTCPW